MENLAKGGIGFFLVKLELLKFRNIEQKKYKHVKSRQIQVCKKFQDEYSTTSSASGVLDTRMRILWSIPY